MKTWMKIAVSAAVVVVSGTAGATAAAVHDAVQQQAPVHSARAVTPQANPETLFVPVTPCRAIDTRKAGGKMKSGQVRNFYVAGTAGFPAQGGPSGGCGVPSSATAVAIAFKVVNPTSTGILRAWPDGTPMPNATVLSWAKGLSLADASTLPITAGPGLDISAKVGPDSVNIVADVTGYYAPQIYAQISADGTISTGTPRVVSVSHSANSGSYQVTLDRPARQCSLTATTYNLYRYASVGLSSSSTPNVVSVYVWYLNGSTATATDYPFFLQVMC